MVDVLSSLLSSAKGHRSFDGKMCASVVIQEMHSTFIIYEGHSVFLSLAFKARSTILIFVECITFHQTSLLDDVHKVLTVFTGHKLCFGMFLSIPLIYWNTADLVLH